MNGKAYWLVCCATGAVSSVCSPSAAQITTPASTTGAATQAAPAANDTAKPGGGLEEIVVTATRRAERLQDIPVAVTALTPSTMRSAGIADVRQLTQVVPGFFGGKNLGLFLPVIRGVGSSSNSAGDEPNVATYIDGIYQPDPFSTYIDLAEVERVEVLRGPQGTVFGRNATGGLINVITPEPEFDTHGDFSAKYGRLRNDTNDVDLRGYITGPATDNLAADFSGIYRKTGDFVKNVIAGEPDAGGIRVIDVRSKLLFKPSSSSQIILTGEYADQKSSTNALQPLNNQTLGRSYPGVVLPTGPWQISVDQQPELDFTRYNLALRTKFEFGAVNLETSTGYMHNKTIQLTDSDSSNIPIGVVNAEDPAITTESISQEVRLLSAGSGPFKWLVGAYAFHLKADAGVHIFSNPAGTVGTGTNTTLDPTVWTTSYAGFGEGTYELAKSLFLTAGVRYTWEKREFDQVLNGRDLFGKLHKDFDKVTYRAALRYNFASNANIYASYGTGYKSGVYNYVQTTTAPVNPETIKAWEVGLKADPLHWLRTNLSAFYYNYNNLQVQSKSPVGNTFILQNAASARIYGGELEVTAAVTHDLNLRGSVAYAHGDYRNFPNAQTFQPLANGGNVGVTADVSGNQMTRSPRVSMNGGIDWGHDFQAGRLSVAANVYHSSRVFFDFANLYYQKPYTLLSGEIAWTLPDGLRFSVWASNLTNAKVFREIRVSASGTDASFEQPRKVGVGVAYKF